MRDFHQPARSTVHATNGMCASSHPLASAAAVDILRRGGNAADAAIAAALICGLGEPAMAGLGGDMFALVKPAGSEEVWGLNGSGRAPKALTANHLRAEGLDAVPVGSPHAVTIPTAVDGFIRLSETHGRLGLDAVLAPAIQYAEDGIPTAPRAAFDWAKGAAKLNGAARMHFLNDGEPYATGQVFRAPGQAEVLRRVAKEGRAGFYQGEVAADMVASLNALGGLHTEEDFAEAGATEARPISASYRGREIIELPPNNGGATALLMARMAENVGLGGFDPFGTERAHLEAEITKLAMDARNRVIGDPASTTRLPHLLAEETAQALAALIDPLQARPQADIAAATEEIHRETIYLCVIDRDRMAVSLIYSIFHDFGSGLASDRFRILFHNRGAGFNLTPGHPNELGPGKRPMHTILPAMLRDGGRVAMPFGVMGGQYQPTGQLRLISNLFDYGMDLQQAIDGARSFAIDGALRLERGYGPDIAEALTAMGHRIERPDVPIGGAQAIWIDAENGALIGASDPRKDGCALGY
jgi:gamma-glutamyltranspeptidase/glutathione hydrolase